MKPPPKPADTPRAIAPVDWNVVLADCDRWLRTVVFSRLRDIHATDEVMQEVALAFLEDPGEETPRTIAVQSPPSSVRPWGAATFVMDGDGGRELEVPVFDLDPDARQLLLESSTAALDDLRHQLQSRGYDVQRIVHWSPVEMGGGQQILVPIGDFEISPISTRPIQ